MFRLLASLSILAAIAVAQSTDYSDEYCTKIEFLYRPYYSSYIALGDSYAAGLGSLERLRQCEANETADSPVCTTEVAGNTCNKDEGSYAYQFAIKHVAPGGFSFPACSGANSTVVLDTQVDYVESQDLVTIQAGGDDYHAFIDVLTSCLQNFNGSCAAAVNVANATLSQVQTSVGNDLKAINEIVPNTTTKALIGYLQFFGEEDTCELYIPDSNATLNISLDSRTRVNNLVVLANSYLKNVASSHGFLYVDADSSYNGHRWCDLDSAYFFITDVFVNGTDSGGQAYNEFALGHPTLEGQQMYLQALEQVLKLS